MDTRGRTVSARLPYFVAMRRKSLRRQTHRWTSLRRRQAVGIVSLRVLACGMRRNDGLATPFGEPVPEPVRVIGADCREFAWDGRTGKQNFCSRQVMRMAGR